MLTPFVAAFVLGLLFNAAPGPVFAETVRRGVCGGFRPALAVQLGSLVGDLLWAVLGLAGVGLLLRLDVLHLPIGVACVAYLSWLAWDAWQAADQAFAVTAGDREIVTHQALRSGVLLSITNPQNITYWAALGSALGTIGVQDPTVSDYAVFVAGFMAASIVWAVVCAALVDRLLGQAGLRWARLTYRACALAFLALAFSSLRELWVAHFAPATAQKPAIYGKP